MTRKTRFVRVKLDYVLQFKDEFDTLPRAMWIVDATDIHDVVARGLRQLMTKNKERGRIRVLPKANVLAGAHCTVGLHFPKKRARKKNRVKAVENETKE